MRRTIRTATAACLTAAVAAGCGDGAPRQATTTRAPHQAPAPPPAPPVRTVHFRARDGRKVVARYAPAGAHAPAVVLLHEIRGGIDQWDPLVPYLHAAGFATLAYESRSSWIESERLPDLLAAIRWLRARPDVDRRRIGLVGASIGASTAVLAMATGARRTVDAAVALSPPDSPDIFKLQDAGRYRPHDMLLASDAAEFSSVEGMMQGAVRSRALRSRQDGHGVELLHEARVRDALIAWLRARVRR
jgi:dienelactone hydrolase